MDRGAILMRFPEGAVSDIPKDWKPPAIGTVAEVKAVFEGIFPGQRHFLGQTCVDGDGFWIEFNYGKHVEQGKLVPVKEEELIEAIGIRSNVGAGAMAAMTFACEKLGCRMMDCQSGELADFSEQTEISMTEFAEWRDRALGRVKQADGD